MLKLHHNPQLDPRTRCGSSLINSLYILQYAYANDFYYSSEM